MTVLSATTGYHATHIHDITYPAYVKSAATSHIVCVNVYIMCIDNCKYVLKSTLCTEYMYVYSAYCLLCKYVLSIAYVNCFCTVWSTLSRISLTCCGDVTKVI